jgi:transcriptional regulator with XRE-family HTH domain
MILTKTPGELETELGIQVRDLRIRQNINQQTLASQAGVALNSVKNLEAGKGATITSLVKILRSLGRADWLLTLAPEVSISPLQMLKSKSKRQRASRKRGDTRV